MKNRINHFIDSIFEAKWSLYLIFALTAFIVLSNISRESLWLDEIFSASTATKTASYYGMFRDYIFNDVHPPLYSTFLYFWAGLFGDSDTNLRLLSYLFVLLSFVISYQLISKENSRRLAVIFIALSAFTPSILFYSQEVRSYALLYSLSNIATVLFSIFIARIQLQQRIEQKYLILFSVIGAMLCLTHYFGYVIIFSLAITALVFATIKSEADTAKKLFIYSLFIFVVGIAWLFIHLYFGDVALRTGGNFWVPNDIASAIKRFYHLFLGDNRRLVLILSALLVLILTLSLIKLKKLSLQYLLLLLTALVTIGTAQLISLHTPILDARNLIVIIPALLLFIAHLFNSNYEKNKLLISGYIVLLIMSGAIDSHRYTKQHWKEASQYVDTKFDPMQCKIPIEIPDPSSGLNMSMYPAYYSNKEFEYLSIGPTIQQNCDLIYFRGQISKEFLVDLLKQHNINQPYKILDFSSVFVVIKD